MDKRSKQLIDVKTLQRKIIIRETDFEKVSAAATRKIKLVSLYDRAWFEPLEFDLIKKDYIVEVLSGNVANFSRSDHGIIRRYLSKYKWKLYNNKYPRWRVISRDQHVLVQARANTTASRLGWAYFEKDFDNSK